MDWPFRAHGRARLGVGAVAGVASALLLTGATSAWPGGAPAFSTAAAAPAKPTSDISGSGQALAFHPSSLRATWSGKAEKPCTAAKASFVITNDTGAPQQPTARGKALGPVLKAGASEAVCAWGSGTAQATISLKADPQAKLVVHFSS